MKLETNWRDWWKWLTTHAFVLMTAYLATVAWMEKTFPAVFNAVPFWVWCIGAVICAVLFFLAQIVQQASTSKPTP